MRIHSEVGNGTTVCIYLPRYLGKAEAAEAQLDLTAVPRAGPAKAVLAVNDEATICMLVAEVLGDPGYDAIGLAILRSDAHVDLLVTDVGLPSGMNTRQMADMARFDVPI